MNGFAWLNADGFASVYTGCDDVDLCFYFVRVLALLMTDTDSFSESSDHESGVPQYSVKLINPWRKSDYSDRPWRKNSKFHHMEDLVRQLKVAFKEADPEADIGFIEPGHGRKRWISDPSEVYKSERQPLHTLISFQWKQPDPNKMQSKGL